MDLNNITYKSITKAVLQGKTLLNIPLTRGKDSCVLPISVGWDYHEGEFIKATIDLVDREFKSCRIVVCDTLQTHSIQHTLSYVENKYDSYYDYAYELGSLWIQDYKPLIDRMNIPVQFTRWNEYTSDKMYDIYKRDIVHLLQSNTSIKESFKETAQKTYEGFLKAGRLTESNAVKTDFLKSSMDYLIEECAVILLWEKYQESILLYPKALGAAINDIMNYYWGVERNFLRPLQIRFKTKNLS